MRASLRLVGCFALLVLLGVSLSGCPDEETGHAPVARITAEPRAIPEHDEFQTEVTLDGSDSSDPIDDPDGGLPLGYHWEVSGDEMQLTTGSMSSPTFSARFQGSRPATIRLTVTDPSGQSGSARFQLGLTVAQ